MLSDILRKLYAAESINILKEETFTNVRLKQVLRIMVELDKGPERIIAENYATRFI